MRSVSFAAPGALLVLLLAGCGGGSGATGTTTPKGPSGPPLHLAPTTDLAQSAGLSWLIDVEPRALASHAELLPALDTALPQAQVAGFTERNGLDPLALDELVVASYAAAENEAASSTLYLARGAVEPGRLETIFRRRAEIVDGRAIDRPGDEPIVRTWGTVRGDRAQLAVFGHGGLAVEVGRFGPLRVAELFAQEKLKRASPALRTGVLARAAELLRGTGNESDAGSGEATADAPIRAFALGPFEGESAKGLGGLLAGSTAAAVSARPALVNDHAAFNVVLVLTGGWGAEAAAAGERLKAAFDALSAGGLGRLSGLDRPLGPVQVDARGDALRLTVALDALALARGARAAMGAEASEIMSY